MPVAAAVAEEAAPMPVVAAAAAEDAPVPGSEAAAAAEAAPMPAAAEVAPTVAAEAAEAAEAAAVAAASGSGGAAAAAAESGVVGYGLDLAGFGLANQSASETKNIQHAREVRRAYSFQAALSVRPQTARSAARTSIQARGQQRQERHGRVH
jgi:hypothetical protein